MAFVVNAAMVYQAADLPAAFRFLASPESAEGDSFDTLASVYWLQIHKRFTRLNAAARTHANNSHAASACWTYIQKRTKQRS